MQLTTMVAQPANRFRVCSPSCDNYLRPPALLSVELDEGEEVEWIWTHDADGRSMLTGYRRRPNLTNIVR